MTDRPALGATGLPSFSEIFSENAPYAWRVLRRMGVAESDADDVCQEVFVVVFRKLATYRPHAALRTWIYGICVRVASDYRRRLRSRREQPADVLPEAAVAADQDASVERRRARDLLDAFLEGLDEDKRAVFVLYELEELSIAEVARAVGCPLQTAYSRLNAARKRFEEALQAARNDEVVT